MTEELLENVTKRRMWCRQAHFSRRFSSLSLRIDRRADSGSQIVTMMQAAQPRHPNNPALLAGIAHRLATGGRSSRKCEMRSVFVVIAHVLKHEPFQMPFIENDHVVEQIPAAATNPALGNAVLPRTPVADSLRPKHGFGGLGFGTARACKRFLCSARGVT